MGSLRSDLTYDQVKIQLQKLGEDLSSGNHFKRKLNFLKWFKHMFLILVKCLFLSGKDMLQENEEKGKYLAK